MPSLIWIIIRNIENMKSKFQTGNRVEALVSLPIASQLNIDPIPDRKLFGRFSNLLKSVGATEDVFVRSRMITIISSTHFKTLGGSPVSLVGLHGKDEVLVVGPTWALHRLATGDVPKRSGTTSAEQAISIAKSFSAEQLFWFTRIYELVAAARGVPHQQLENCRLKNEQPGIFEKLEKDDDWNRVDAEVITRESELNQANACDMLQGLLMRSMDDVLAIWDSNDWCETIVRIVQRRESHLTSLREVERDPYNRWWLGYDDIPEEDAANTALCKSNYRLDGEGIDVSLYPEFRRTDEYQLARVRTSSIHQRWLKLSSLKPATA